MIAAGCEGAEPDQRDPTRRFTERVGHYVLGRPDYPPAAIGWLGDVLGLESHHRVLDLGCGTGLLSRRFLERGHVVLGLEPNPAMRAAAELALGADPRFVSVDGRAEATGLTAGAADVAVAGQAFHWFHVERTRAELGRVLTGAAPVALVWNNRVPDGSAFLSDYEAFVRQWAADYAVVGSRVDLEARIDSFFVGGHDHASFDNEQRHDRDGLRHRVLSASYMPGPGQPGHEAMLGALDALFDDHARDGEIVFTYQTDVHLGTLRPVGR